MLCESGSILKLHGVNTDKQWYPIKMLSGMDLLAVSYCEVLVLFFSFPFTQAQECNARTSRVIVFKSVKTMRMAAERNNLQSLIKRLSGCAFAPLLAVTGVMQ